jgi:ribosomal protein S12 methylthiotransferase accessory factor
MEAIEYAHRDLPPSNLRRASLAELIHDRQGVVRLDRLSEFVATPWFNPERVVEWVEAEALCKTGRVWVPAAGAYFLERPRLFVNNENGLASGNSLLEATLHALYEILERHLISKAIGEGGEMDVLDPSSVHDECVRELLDKVEAAGLKTVLLSPPLPTPLPVFMAVLLDPSSRVASDQVHRGCGAHLSRSVAASRAITEAAQSRVMLMGDLGERIAAPSDDERRSLHDRFASAQPNLDWGEVPDLADPLLDKDYASVMQCLEELGLTNAYRVDLTRHAGIHVVKVLVEGARMMPELFGGVSAPGGKS